MNKLELKKLAIERLNTEEIKIIKKQLLQDISDKKEKDDCIAEFDKNFIKSFIRWRQNQT
jgi:hypothetical protein